MELNFVQKNNALEHVYSDSSHLWDKSFIEQFSAPYASRVYLELKTM